MKGSGKRIRRILALALCLAMLLPALDLSALAQEGEIGPTETQITETPGPGPTDTPVPEPADTPVPAGDSVSMDTPDPEPTDTPVPPETPAPDETPETSASPETSESPTPAESPDTSEPPELSESPEPTESPEPAESPEPSESPEPTESPEPAAAAMAWTAASMVDPESGETLWQLESGETECSVRWTLDRELRLLLRADCPVAAPADPESPEDSAPVLQVRITLSPMFTLLDYSAGEDVSVEYGPLSETGEPPASGGVLVCTLSGAASALELELRLTVARERWEAEPQELISQAVTAELLSVGSPCRRVP